MLCNLIFKSHKLLYVRCPNGENLVIKVSFKGTARLPAAFLLKASKVAMAEKQV
jgi:hypothetical protein